MKTPSEEIFKLVKSLNSHEKRLFKLYAQKNSEYASYLQLFDAIDLLKQYDEKKLVFILDKKGGINNLRRIKNYLLEALLSFLEYQYFDSSIEIQLQRQLQRIEVLFNKGLIILAKKHVIKAEKIAIENHQYPSLFSILQWKRKILIRETDIPTVKKTEQKQFINELDSIDLYRNLIEYQKISDEVGSFIISQGETLDKNSIIKLNEMLNNPYLIDERKALSFPAKMFYWRISGDIHLVLKNWKKGYKCMKQAISYFDKSKLIPSERLNVYSKLLIALLKLNKADELLLLKRDAEILVKSQTNKTLTNSLFYMYIPFVNNCVINQLLSLNTDEALLESDEIVEMVEKYGSGQSFLIYYYARFSLFFLEADYRKALFCANKVLSYEKKGIRTDIISDMKFFYLVNQYELGNEDLLQNICKTYTRSFNKKLRQNKVENILLNFFGTTIHKNTNKQDRKNIFLVLKKELEFCKNEKILNYFDFISWAESKIENRPFMDIMKEKTKLIR